MVETLPRRVVATQRVAVGFWLWLAVGLLLFTCAAVFRQSELAWLAVWPLAMALFLKALGQRSFEMHLGDSSLSINHDPPIAFDSITRVKAVGNPTKKASTPAAFPILVRHAAGHFVIPAKLDVSSSELLAFLQDKAPPYVLQLDERLNDYLAQQEQIFGDRVAIFVGESGAGEAKHSGLAKAIVATSLLSTVVGFAAYASGWGNDGALILATISLVTFVVTGLLALVAFSRSQGSSNVEDAGLVVSPGGLAMVQGDLVGELRWDEIRNAKLSRGAVALGRNKSFHGDCIHLSVEGATVTIADIYHEPVSQIYAKIMRLKSV